MIAKRSWDVELARAAKRDFIEIIAYTHETFGACQAKIYEDLLADAIDSLVDGPDAIGSKSREDISPGVCSLHITLGGRGGRHFVMYRANENERVIDVLRILHDASDLARHIPGES